MNWKLIDEQNIEAVGRSRRMHKAWQDEHDATAAWRDFEKLYARPLLNFISRRANKIVREHKGSWIVRVNVSPMVNGSDHTASAFVRLRWGTKGTDIDTTALLTDDLDVAAFLERFEATVAASQK